jgi:hypothetical protein
MKEKYISFTRIEKKQEKIKYAHMRIMARGSETRIQDN